MHSLPKMRFIGTIPFCQVLHLLFFCDMIHIKKDKPGMCVCFLICLTYIFFRESDLILADAASFQTNSRNRT